MKKALVCGAGGFIGYNLVEKLKKENYWVRGVDLHSPQYSKSAADEFLKLNLTKADECKKAILVEGKPVDEIFQLAADMGGAGYIEEAACDIMKNSTLININMVSGAAEVGVKRYFFSSSACVYRDMKHGEKELKEEDAIPANPDNDYGWEKLFQEKVAAAFGRKYKMKVRIGRFQNTYGPRCAWYGGREKAVAAICRKVAQAESGGSIEVWGDGTAVRSHLFIDDLVNGIFLLMSSDLNVPVNIGSPEYVTVDQLVNLVIGVSGKKLTIKHIKGPVGVTFRNFSNAKAYSIGWQPKTLLKEGVRKTYEWIEEQVRLYPEKK